MSSPFLCCIMVLVTSVKKKVLKNKEEVIGK